jgi:tRNA threonylcarbamoyl adenosine modification protein (Sua5/YciO/YrdC/YwlC family)
MLLKVYGKEPSPTHIKVIVEALKEGKVIVYPTDTVYAIGCDMNNNKAIERLCQIIGKKPEKANLSLICSNLSNISEFTLPFESRVYKLMRKTLPGPYTFILNANNKVPKIFKTNKKTIGVRIPNHPVPEAIVDELGNPIVTASIKDEDKILEYTTDPVIIHEHYKNIVDLVIDGGHGDNIPSTVIDCTGDEIQITREGKGLIDLI